MSELIRTTVNVHPRSRRALSEAMEKTGDNQTDSVNRAVCWYPIVLELVDQYGGYLPVVFPDGSTARVYLTG